MFGKNLLPDPQRFLKRRFGFAVVPDLCEKEPEVIQGSGRLGVFRPTSALCHFNRSFRNGNLLLIFSLFNLLEIRWLYGLQPVFGNFPKLKAAA